MTSKEFIKDMLLLDKDGEYNDGILTIHLENSNEYSQVYSKLDKLENINLDSEKTIMTEHSSILNYYTDEFDIKLEADFDNDTYRLIVEEI